MKLTDAYVTTDSGHDGNDPGQLSILKKLLKNNMEKVLETALIFDNAVTMVRELYLKDMKYLIQK